MRWTKAVQFISYRVPLNGGRAAEPLSLYDGYAPFLARPRIPGLSIALAALAARPNFPVYKRQCA